MSVVILPIFTVIFLRSYIGENKTGSKLYHIHVVINWQWCLFVYCLLIIIHC